MEKLHTLCPKNETTGGNGEFIIKMYSELVKEL